MAKYQHSSGTIVEVISTFSVSLDGNYVNCTAYIDSEAQYHVAATADFDSAFTPFKPTYEYQVLVVKEGIASILPDQWATKFEVSAASQTTSVSYSIIPETKRIRA